MSSKTTRKCLHCNEDYHPDPRNGGRQNYCVKPGCQQTSKAASQRQWLSRSENRDYFRGAENCERVRLWRLANPGYRHIQGPTPRALALYLFLCTVADAEGLSYYSDASAGALLTCSGSELRAARAELVAAALIAYQNPFYQVLGLEPKTAAAVATAAQPRIGDVRSIGEIFRAMMEAPK